MSLCACCCTSFCQPAEDRSQPQTAAGGGPGFRCWPRHVKQLVNMQCHSCPKLCRDEGCLPAPLRVLAADPAAPARSAHEPLAGSAPAAACTSAQRQTELLRLQSPMPQDTGRQRVCSRCCWAHLQHRICNHVPDKQGPCEVHACCEGCSQLALGSSQAERQHGDVERELGDGGHSQPTYKLDPVCGLTRSNLDSIVFRGAGAQRGETVLLPDPAPASRCSDAVQCPNAW